MLVASLLLAGTAASGAISGVVKSLSKKSSNEQQLNLKDSGNELNNSSSDLKKDNQNIGVGNGGEPGNSCFGRDQVKNNDIENRQGDEKGNGGVADCSPSVKESDPPVPPSGGLFQNNQVVINAEDQTIPFDGKEKDIKYSVQPTSAVCSVKYNGLSAKPVEKGMYDSRIICTHATLASAQKNVILTITDEIKKEEIKNEAAKPASVRKLKPIKVPFTLASSKIGSKSMTKIRKFGSSSAYKSVTVYGYAQPSGNSAADLKLSRQRAEAVASQIRKMLPTLRINIKAMGSKINRECRPENNKCVIVK